MSEVRKPREWAGPMGSVCGDVEEDGARTVHVRLPHAVLTARECRIMCGWMARAATWIEAKATADARIKRLAKHLKAIEKEGGR